MVVIVFQLKSVIHSNHGLISHCFQDKRQNRLKIAYIPTLRVLNAPDEGVPLGIWYRRNGF